MAYRDAFALQKGLYTSSSDDHLLLLEHPHVYTLGIRGDLGHLLRDPAEVGAELEQTDRGGDVTYHGPGQLVVYPLIDLKRAGLGVRDLVTALEQAVISYAGMLGIYAQTRPKAPGVFVQGRKLASVGIRVRRGASYHGLALNVNMDLAPFSRIDPCGYPGLAMTQLADHAADITLRDAADAFGPWILAHLYGGPR